MEAKTRKLVVELGREKSKSLFLFCNPGEFINRRNGVQDSTHLNSYGAHQVANLFIDGVKDLKLSLVSFLK
jgi:hypothetical protein